jgi:hypothetical protein
MLLQRQRQQQQGQGRGQQLLLLAGLLVKPWQAAAAAAGLWGVLSSCS